MSFSGRLSNADSQILTFPRLELLQKVTAIVVAAATTKSLPKSSVSPKYPSPEFGIGDLVASDWESDEEDDDIPDSATDFGEILGLRWTHSTCGSDSCYPCYDGEPTRACDLRLVQRA